MSVTYIQWHCDSHTMSLHTTVCVPESEQVSEQVRLGWHSVTHGVTARERRSIEGNERSKGKWRSGCRLKQWLEVEKKDGTLVIESSESSLASSRDRMKRRVLTCQWSAQRCRLFRVKMERASPRLYGITAVAFTGQGSGVTKRGWLSNPLQYTFNTHPRETEVSSKEAF